jgi:hypothetical protein
VSLRPSLTFLVPLGVALAALTGCGRLERAEQCALLAELTNPRLAAIAELNREPPSAENYKKIAAEYRRIGESLAPLSLSRKAMADAVTDYGRQILLVESEATRAATALGESKRDDYAAARRAIGKLAHQLAQARSRVEIECR